MPSGNPRSPKLQKDALAEAFGSTSPDFNTITFQYSPEELTRTLTPWEPSTAEEGATERASERAQPFNPDESIISMTLRLHAADELEERETHPITGIPSVADRIAALEVLLYPARMMGKRSLQSRLRRPFPWDPAG